jgi:hypothetical protein
MRPLPGLLGRSPLSRTGRRATQHGQGDVAVPGVVAPHLIVVDPNLVLRGLEALLDRPPGPRHCDQVGVEGAGRPGTQVVRQLRLLPPEVPETRLTSCDLPIFVEKTAESVVSVDVAGVGLVALWKGT